MSDMNPAPVPPAPASSAAVSTTSSLPSAFITVGSIVAAVLGGTGVANVTPGVEQVLVGSAAIFTALHVHVAIPRGTGSKLVAALQSVLKVLGG